MLPSFEEKSVWVQLVGLVIVMVGYFAVSGVMMAKGAVVLVPYVPVFAVAVGLLLAVNIAGHVIAALTGKPEKRDERDRLIGWRAESNSSWLLAAGVFCALSAMVFRVETVWVAHLLLASMFGSEILKLSLQAVYYRRGV